MSSLSFFIMKSLLKTLSDDTPKNVDFDMDHLLRYNDIKDEITMILTTRPQSSILTDEQSMKFKLLNYGVDTETQHGILNTAKAMELIDRVQLALSTYYPLMKNIVVALDDIAETSFHFTISGDVCSKENLFHVEWSELTQKFRIE